MMSSSDGSVALARLDGEVDVANSSMINGELEHLIGPECAVVVIDLRDVTFVDTTFFRALSTTSTRLGATVGVHIVVEPDSVPARVLTLTRLGAMFAIYVRLSDAIQSATAGTPAAVGEDTLAP